MGHFKWVFKHKYCSVCQTNFSSCSQTITLQWVSWILPNCSNLTRKYRTTSGYVNYKV